MAFNSRKLDNAHLPNSIVKSQFGLLKRKKLVSLGKICEIKLKSNSLLKKDIITHKFCCIVKTLAENAYCNALAVNFT